MAADTSVQVTAPAQSNDKRSSLAVRMVHMMADHPHLGCAILAVLFTLLSRYVNGLNKPLVRHQPPPRRFFSLASLVLDYPYGNLGDVGSLLVEEEVLFVMYYAPWCVESKRTRAQFEKAAVFLKNDVRFVAVNCWYPNGMCRKQNNFLRYPALFLYLTSLDSYKYQGVLTAEYMVQFVQKILEPLTYLRTKEQLGMFLAERDNAVVGFFDFTSSPQPLGFQQYYYASMRTYALDHKNSVDFGIITNAAVAVHYDLIGNGAVHMFRSINSTLMYPYVTNMTSSSITAWAITYRQRTFPSWVLPSGMKSLTLSSAISDSPALLLFVPNHPSLQVQNPYFSILHEIGLQYRNCENKSHVSSMVSAVKLTRWVQGATFTDLMEKCKKTDNNSNQSTSSLWDKLRLHSVPTKRCCQSVRVTYPCGQYNSCDVCHTYEQTNPASRHACDLKTVVDHLLWSKIEELVPAHLGDCVDFVTGYNPGQFLTVCCGNSSYDKSLVHTQYIPSLNASEHSDPYILSVTRRRQRSQCEKLSQQVANGWMSELQASSWTASLDSSSSRLRGQSCLTNNSLQLLLLDTALSRPIIDKLALNITVSPNQVTAAIYDKQVETQYVMELPFTKSNLVDFIENFTSGDLPAHRRSSPINPRKPCSSNSEICIVEVSGAEFRDFVANNIKDVVVLFYTPWCGFCASFSHVYLSLAQYFKSSHNVVFARINAYTNDLPWEYTVDIYPTIMLFPAQRNADSVAFPDHLQKSLPNLIYFVLHYGDISVKIETALSICSSSCLQTNTQAAVEQIHSLNRDILTMQHSLSAVQEQLESRVPVSSTGDTVNQSESSLLQWCRRELTRRVLAARIKQHEARFLHRELAASQRPFMERHRLLRLLNKYKVYHARYLAVLSGDAGLHQDVIMDMAQGINAHSLVQ